MLNTSKNNRALGDAYDNWKTRDPREDQIEYEGECPTCDGVTNHYDDAGCDGECERRCGGHPYPKPCGGDCDGCGEQYCEDQEGATEKHCAECAAEVAACA